MIGKCASPSDFCGSDDCCICCEKQDSCQCKCDDIDSYEYAEECEEYETE